MGERRCGICNKIPQAFAFCVEHGQWHEEDFKICTPYGRMYVCQDCINEIPLTKEERDAQETAA